MKTELFFARGTSEERKAEVRRAFRDRGVSIAGEGPLAIKSIDVFGTRIDAAFILETIVAGILYDLEKDALKRGLRALRDLAAAGTVSIDYRERPAATPPTIYFLPNDEERDAAFDAVDADFDSDATGQRLWLRGVGWRSMNEILEIEAAAANVGGPESPAASERTRATRRRRKQS